LTMFFGVVLSEDSDVFFFDCFAMTRNGSIAMNAAVEFDEDLERRKKICVFSPSIEFYRKNREHQKFFVPQ